jgi:hypothetical protein
LMPSEATKLSVLAARVAVRGIAAMEGASPGK